MFLGVARLGTAWHWEALSGAIAVLAQLTFVLVSLIYVPIAKSARGLRAMIPLLMSMIINIPGIRLLVYWWRSRTSITFQFSTQPIRVYINE